MIPGVSAQPIKYWWANQRRRWRVERELGHVFAPLPESASKPEQGWENMRHLRPGHVIIHNKSGKIMAVSRVTAPPAEVMRPTLPDESETEKQVAGYRVRGNLVEVEYHDLVPPIPVNDIDLQWRTPRHGPFNDKPKTLGRPEQIYMEMVSPAFIDMLRKEFSDRWPTGF